MFRVWPGRLVAAALLAGCASQADVERSAPIYTGEFAGNYQSLAVCIARAWNAEIGSNVFQLMDDAPNRVAYITIGGRNALVFYETKVREIAAGQVLVEYRRVPGPDVIPIADYVWKSVEDCGTQQQTAS